jgi:imidazolonepropionase-like amidohydrolase
MKNRGPLRDCDLKIIHYSLFDILHSILPQNNKYRTRNFEFRSSLWSLFKLNFSLLIILLSLSITFDLNAQIAVKGKTIYTMNGEPIQNGIILIKDKKIEAVGSDNQITIPSDYKIIEGNIITPGLIDAHSVVGLSGLYNYNHDQEQLEKSDAIQPELRAIDAYNKDDKLVDYFLSLGITTIHTGHAPGALASGQTMIVKTYSESFTDYVIDSVSMVAFTLGSSIKNNYEKPGTRSKGVAMLRQEFYKAIEYGSKLKKSKPEEKPARDLKMETLLKVLNGEIRALFSVNRAADIMASLRLAEEFNLNMVLDGVAEAYLIVDELKKYNYPIILHPPMMRAIGDYKNASFETAANLHKEGFKFALQSSYESYVPKTRVVLFEAAVANAYGLPIENALASITIDAADLLGISSRVGSIEKGKDADIVIFDDNPFEYTSHVCKVIVNGKIVKEECF